MADLVLSLQIAGVDNASPALNAIKDALAGLGESMSGLIDSLAEGAAGLDRLGLAAETVAGQVSALGEHAAGLGGSVATLDEAFAGIADHVGAAGSAVEDMGVHVGDAATGLADLGTHIESVGSVMDEAASHAAALSDSVSGMTTGLSAGSAAADQIGGSVDTAGQHVAALSDATTALSDVTTEAAGHLGEAGVAVGDLGSHVASTGSVIEDAAAHAANLSEAMSGMAGGLGDGAAATDKFAGSAGAMGSALDGLMAQFSALGESAATLTAAMGEAGAAAEGAGAKAAAAGSEAEASEGGFGKLGDTIKELGKTALEFVGFNVLMSGITDLSSAFEKGLSTAESMGESIHKLTETTGLSAEEVSPLVAAMEKFGVSADATTGVLDRFAKNLETVTNASAATLKGTTGVVGAFKDLGIDVDALHGSMPPLNDALELVADRFAAMPDGVAKTSAAMAIFGRNAGPDMIQFLNLGSQGIKDAEATAEKYGLQLSTENVEQVHAFGLAHKDLDAAISGVMLQIGVAFMPMLTNLAQLVAAAAEAFNSTIMPAIHAFGSTLSDLMTGAMASFENAWPKIEDAMQPFLPTADRVGALLQAMGAAVSDIVPNLTTFAENVLKMGTGMTSAATTGDTLKLAISQIANVVNTVSAAIQSGTTYLVSHKEAYSALTSIVAGVATAVAAYEVAQLAATVATTAGAAAAGAISVATTAWGVVVGVATGEITLMTIAQDALNFALTANPIGLVVIGLGALVAGLVYAYQNSEQFRDIVNGAWAAVQVAATALFDAISTGLADLVGLWNSDWGGIQEVVRATWTAIKAVIDLQWNAIQEAIKLGLDLVKGLWTGDWTSMQTDLQAAWTAITTAVADALPVIHDLIDAALTWIHDRWLDAWNGVVELLRTAWNDIVSAMADALQTVRDDLTTWASDFTGVLQNLIGSARDLAAQIGSAIIDGISGAIQHGVQAVADAATNLVHAAITSAENAGHSPTVHDFQLLGEGMVGALGQALVDGTSTIATYSTDLATAAIDPAVASIATLNSAIATIPKTIAMPTITGGLTSVGGGGGGGSSGAGNQYAGQGSQGSYTLPNTVSGGSITVQGSNLSDAIANAAKQTGVSASAQAAGGTFGSNSNPSLAFDLGGMVPGPVGQPIIATVHGGEMVIPPGGAGAILPPGSSGLALPSGGGGGPAIDYSRLAAAVATALTPLLQALVSQPINIQVDKVTLAQAVRAQIIRTGRANVSAFGGTA